MSVEGQCNRPISGKHEWSNRVMIVKHVASALIATGVLLAVAGSASAECRPVGWSEGPNPKVTWKCDDQDQ
jgi:hypothetical protein